MTANETRRNEIRRAKREIENDLLDMKNVHGVDIANKITDGEDTGELSIVVYVTKKGGNLAKKDRVPEEIDGIPTDVQEVEQIRPHPALAMIDDIEIRADEVRYDTLMGGMSIGPCRSIFMEPPDVDAAGNYVFTGTLGAIVKDRSTNEHKMLTNFHVACVDDSWSVGDTIAQPSRVDTGSCPADVVGDIARAVLSENVDGAVLDITDRPTSCEIIDIGDVEGTAAAVVDSSVRKRGRTTGYTHGTVTSVDYTTTIPYGDGIGDVVLRDQIRIVVDASESTQFGNSGDSGSVVVDADNKVVGLYFAGTSDGGIGVANPIAAVLDELDIDMCVVSPKFYKETVKEFAKENIKEFADEVFKWQPDKWLKEHVKELKETSKEYAKDWKEWAYEKGDWENSPVRPPSDRDPVRPPDVRGPARPPLGRFARTGRGPTLGARTAFDLTGLPPGDVPNPVALPGASATVLAYDATMPTFARYVDWAGPTGLDVDYHTSIVLCEECPAVVVTLQHFSAAPTVEAYDADGNLLDAATMSGPGPEDLCLDGRGRGIKRLTIDAPQDETVLLRLKCVDRCDRTPDGKPCQSEKPWLADKPAQFDKPSVADKGLGEGRQPFIGRELRPDLRRGPFMHEAGRRR